MCKYSLYFFLNLFKDEKVFLDIFFNCLWHSSFFICRIQHISVFFICHILHISLFFIYRILHISLFFAVLSKITKSLLKLLSYIKTSTLKMPLSSSFISFISPKFTPLTTTLSTPVFFPFKFLTTIL